MGRKFVNHLKKLLSQREDTARMAYAERWGPEKRQSIFIATTNRAELFDQTGDRRFWIVGVRGFHLEALMRDRDQLWAEAWDAHKRGESIRLDKSLYDAARAIQEAHREVDPWEEFLERRIGGQMGKVRGNSIFSALGLPLGRSSPEDQCRLGRIMRKLGFKRTKARFKGGSNSEWCYVRGNEERKAEISLTMSADEFEREHCNRLLDHAEF